VGLIDEGHITRAYHEYLAHLGGRGGDRLSQALPDSWMRIVTKREDG
jgi:hypothetical protein